MSERAKGQLKAPAALDDTLLGKNIAMRNDSGWSVGAIKGRVADGGSDDSAVFQVVFAPEVVPKSCTLLLSNYDASAKAPVGSWCLTRATAIKGTNKETPAASKKAAATKKATITKSKAAARGKATAGGGAVGPPFPQPRGRPPKGKVWSAQKGEWVDDGRRGADGAAPAKAVKRARPDDAEGAAEPARKKKAVATGDGNIAVPARAKAKAKEAAEAKEAQPMDTSDGGEKPSAAPKRKRVADRKETALASATATSTVTSPEGAGKRRRGRPRKIPAVQAVKDEPQEIPTADSASKTAAAATPATSAAGGNGAASAAVSPAGGGGGSSGGGGGGSSIGGGALEPVGTPPAAKAAGAAAEGGDEVPGSVLRRVSGWFRRMMSPGAPGQ
ncbi:hypothetical protein JKP88DRAFT_330613 [Tribonema minus]|uniref:Uncharacterized protein n=1 Tax=Tribonema minus TaxID=303371 RepID=A0A835YQY0_9STRA|nr:hypothetical protein JKP88DRAFT_330613 [Tribonema minus]